MNEKIYRVQMNKGLPNFSTAVELVDRPQGEWKVKFPYEETGKTRTCSNCNITQTVNVYDGEVRFRFCPYCGAKMKNSK